MRLWNAFAKFWLRGAASKLSVYRGLIRYFHARGWSRTAKFFSQRLECALGIFLPPNAVIPASVEFRHPTSVVIGEGVVMGERVIVYQHVTLGGVRLGDAEAMRYPSIGDDTVIFAGAVLLGQIKIGKNCTIGANAVVLQDVPDNATAVGIPARIILKSNPLQISATADQEAD
ncbi:serine O-acetyltransferase [Ancylobacter sp. G4_0304]|uniref:serine O-acetyltransferase n=1 Tax=Ancylobacter sp. G4_0304 TaxID=3114289 RepID=UPI0039C633E4